MEIELKPCPFCGGKAGLRCDDYINGYTVAAPDYVIECEAPADQCPSHLRMADQDIDQLVAAWNRRAILTPPAPSASPDVQALVESMPIPPKFVVQGSYEHGLADGIHQCRRAIRNALAPFTGAKP